MSIFEFDDYKDFVKDRIQQMPNKGRGEFQKLAVILQMHTTTVSHVFKGDKELTLEQAAKLCGYWGLNVSESDYLITLVELARAGSKELKIILQKRLEELKKHSFELKHRIPKDRILSDSDRFRFYSEWYYSAIRLMCDLPNMNSIDRIANQLDLPVSTINEAIQFLLEAGLVIAEKGQFKLGPRRTFVEATSPLVKRHHANWRIKAIERYPKMKHDVDLALTSPMTLSKDDALLVREILMKTIEKILAINTPSKPEELHILNIDWLSL